MRCAFKLIGIISYLVDPFRLTDQLDFSFILNTKTYNVNIKATDLNLVGSNTLLTDIHNKWKALDPGFSGTDTFTNKTTYTHIYNFFKNLRDNSETLTRLWILAQQSSQTITRNIVKQNMNVRSYIKIRDVHEQQTA
jgi:hypothetical protein